MFLVREKNNIAIFLRCSCVLDWTLHTHSQVLYVANQPRSKLLIQPLQSKLQRRVLGFELLRPILRARQSLWMKANKISKTPHTHKVKLNLFFFNRCSTKKCIPPLKIALISSRCPAHRTLPSCFLLGLLLLPLLFIHRHSDVPPKGPTTRRKWWKSRRSHMTGMHGDTTSHARVNAAAAPQQRRQQKSRWIWGNAGKYDGWQVEHHHAWLLGTCGISKASWASRSLLQFPPLILVAALHLLQCDFDLVLVSEQLQGRKYKRTGMKYTFCFYHNGTWS